MASGLKGIAINPNMTFEPAGVIRGLATDPNMTFEPVAAPSSNMQDVRSTAGTTSIAQGTATTSSSPNTTANEPLTVSTTSSNSSADRNKAVGGVPTFQIGIPSLTTALSYTNQFDTRFPVLTFELPPARLSMHEKQGQIVPGSSAGMSIMTRTNLAKLPIPGARPVLHGMGMGRETITWVGAFIGADDYLTNDGPDSLTQAYQLFDQFKKQREVMVSLGWSQLDTTKSTRISFDGSANFRGYVKDVRRVLATEDRVYYQIIMAITNGATPLDPTRSKVNKDPVQFPITDLTAYPSLENFFTTAQSQPVGAASSGLDTGFFGLEGFQRPPSVDPTTFQKTIEAYQLLANKTPDKNNLAEAISSKSLLIGLDDQTSKASQVNDTGYLHDAKFNNLRTAARIRVDTYMQVTGANSSKTTQHIDNGGAPLPAVRPTGSPQTISQPPEPVRFNRVMDQ